MNEIRDIHEPFAAFLNKNRIPFHRNRPDKKTTAAKGDPDFLCTLANRCLYIEAKVPGGKLSKDQEKRIAYLRQAGNTVKIVCSCEEAISAVQTWLGVENASGGAPASENEPSVRNTDLFIGTIGGKDYVLSGDSGPGGQAKIVRLATTSDLINIRRR